MPASRAISSVQISQGWQQRPVSCPRRLS